MNSTAQLAIDPKLPTGPPLKTALKIVSRSPESRASNAARAALVVANVTPTGYRVGLFMAGHARYAKPEDIRRNVVPGEIFNYWPQAKIAAEMGCSERQVRRGVRSLREAGTLKVRRRVRPCEASYVWILPVRSDVRSESAGVHGPLCYPLMSGVLSGVRSHTEPRTEPQKNHVESSRAREVCKICGNNWPAEYGTECYQCPQPTASQRRDQEFKRRNEEAGAEFERELFEPKGCTCGDAYRQSYGRLCMDCKGEPSAAQRDALREKDGCRGEDDRVGVDGGGADPSVPETETRQPPETRGEPGPNARRFFADFAKWTVGKRTPTQHGSDRRRLTRTARKELADLTKGEQDAMTNRDRGQSRSRMAGKLTRQRADHVDHRVRRTNYGP